MPKPGVEPGRGNSPLDPESSASAISATSASLIILIEIIRIVIAFCQGRQIPYVSRRRKIIAKLLRKLPDSPYFKIEKLVDSVEFFVLTIGFKETKILQIFEQNTCKNFGGVYAKKNTCCRR